MGLTGETLPIHADKDVGSIERVCSAALRQPNRHAALIFLAQSLPSLDTSVPGVRNEGLFVLHELTNDVPQQQSWKDYVGRAKGIIGAEGRDLLTRLGYRIEPLDNLTLLLRSGDRRTALAVLLDQTEIPESGIPSQVVTVETAPWILFLEPNYNLRVEAYLLGVMSSLVCDSWVRRFAEGHIDEEAFNALRIPIPPPNTDRTWRRAVALAGRLAAPDDRFADWAKAVGVGHGPLEPAEKQNMILELDAVVARLYGLDEAQLSHIFETFHEGWDYEPRLKVVLKHFRKWKDA